MKELLRRILFPLMPAETIAESGTWKCHLLNWLYEGDCEPEFTVQWPDEE